MTGHSNSMHFIKSENDEFGGGPHFTNPSYHNQQNYGHFGQHSSGSVDPSQLSMGNGNTGGLTFGFGGQHNMNMAFSMGGGSGFEDNELLESLGGGHNTMDDFSNMPNHHNHHNQQAPGSMSMNQSQMNNMYSHTPDGAPIQSPFMGGNFDYSHYRGINSIPQHMSPHQTQQYINKRPSMQSSQRKSSDQRSPMTPRTAAMNGLHIGTPESSSLPRNGQAIRAPNISTRHQKTMSGQFDSTPGSLHSYLDSPLVSPSTALQAVGISETIGAKHASLPSKVETQNLESQEAKKRRRRASHNAVERRRRDNINDRIQDLSKLVPGHRLDDDRVKKQLASNGAVSPSLGATSMSPPANPATSNLAGPAGRRAASTPGNITIGLPVEDKEKGPNKGDILNGSVTWTRDLMWALYQKYMQEEELAEYIKQLGGQWPYQVSEDDKRMRSEVLDAMERNEPASFSYSRAHGSGLRVPKHTNLAGERLQHGNNADISPQSNLELSPGFHSGGSGTNSGSNGPGHNVYWGNSGGPGLILKEEEEDELMDI